MGTSTAFITGSMSRYTKMETHGIEREHGAGDTIIRIPTMARVIRIAAEETG